MTILHLIINSILLLIGSIYTIVAIYRLIKYLIKRILLYKTEALCINCKVCEVEQEQKLDGEIQTIVVSEYYDLLLQFKDKDNTKYTDKITSNKKIEAGEKIKILWNSKKEKMYFDSFDHFRNLILFVIGLTLIICTFAMS